MNKVIKDIIDRKCSKEEKNKALDLLSDEIKIAKDILSEKFKYCSVCDEYYFAKSFFTEVKTEKTRICVFQSPINSGDNDYVDGIARITYSVCPKGHMREINKQEIRD